MKAIQTEYRGYKFRSRLEARWAVFFDMLAIKYQYEAEGYELTNGKSYLPDFYLPDYDMYVEVKGSWDLFTLQKDLYSQFASDLRQRAQQNNSDYTSHFIVVTEIPQYDKVVTSHSEYRKYMTWDNYSKKYNISNEDKYFKQYEEDDYGLESRLHCRCCDYEYLHIEDAQLVTIECRPATKIKYRCESGCTYTEITYNRKGNLHRYCIDMTIYEDNIFLIFADRNHDKLKDALHAARTARFEYGEVPLSMQIPSIRSTTLQNR